MTGSCEFGRIDFCKSKNIDVNTDNFTVLEFIRLTKNSYNSVIIKQLEESYNY